ncbi:MAG: FAD-dependent monooxygenase [Bacteroidetes bacterium]|nr:FAD-dependent monooxygenase [Bacteroidota bacterium]
MEKKYCIVGGGLVGSLLAVILARRGFRADVWERRPDMRDGTIEGGRSINLALSHRGFRGLELAGLDEEIRKLCIPMHGREVHDENGGTRFMQYGKDGQFINSISRGGLNQLLLREASKYPNIKMHFDERCDDINFRNKEISFYNTTTHQNTREKYDMIFGSDGAFSAVRMALMKSERFDFEYRQDYLQHAYKELSIPAAADGGWRLKKNALHIWPRKSFMLIALPNLDGSFTCTLFLPAKGEVSFEHLTTKDSARQFFTKYFPDALADMPTFDDDFFANPVSDLVTIRCNPWYIENTATLIGDAAHPIVPFYGQGMNAGFEDCTYLAQLMDAHNDDWHAILPAFNQMRKPNADAVADLALRNFIEMRDLVADPHFILKNKIAQKLAELFPAQWQTQYSLVTFSDTPYAEALSRGINNNEILEKIVAENPSIESRLGDTEFMMGLEKWVG